jgi:hypothetical protein
MQADPQRHNADLPGPGDPIDGMFRLPAGQRHAAQDASPVAPQRSRRLHALLLQLWQYWLEGFATCGLDMCPCFADPSELCGFLGPQLHALAERETKSQAEPSPWRSEAPVRQSPQVPGQEWH